MSELNFFYRDTTLSDQLISLYQVRQILLERGFTDMSYLGGGLAANLRYLIASSSAKDVSAFNPDSVECGHVMLQSNTYFKVLDVYHVGDKTQILLLENPDVTTANEEDLVLKAREDFEVKITMAPVRSLQSLDWRERTEFPIGMSGDGKFFEI